MPQAPGVSQAPRRKVGVVAAVAAVALGLDILSKALVVANLTPGEPVHVIGNILEWNLQRNPGAAWSVGTSYTAVFTVLAMVVIGVVIRIAPRLRSTWHAVAFGLLLAGASGNLGDRIFRAPGMFRGDVVDWIEVTRWYPVFNLADSSICIAAVLFVLLSLRGTRMDGSTSGGTTPQDPPASASQGGFAAPSTPQRGETPLSPPSPGEPAQTAGRSIPRASAPTGLGETPQPPAGPRDLPPARPGTTSPEPPATPDTETSRTSGTPGAPAATSVPAEADR
jgi:signal peptidase II